jgi:IPT/TIG domain/Galactose oxidase, central domain
LSPKQDNSLILTLIPFLPKGEMATGCGPGQLIPDLYNKDKLNHLQKDHYYGHPNHKRAKKDPRQCAYHPPTDISRGGYTEPMLILNSSTDGIVEFDSAHFDSQLRGNLIMSQYGYGLYRVILSADGTAVNQASVPAIFMTGDDGLTVTQAPNGNLIDGRFPLSQCYYFQPIEPTPTALAIKSVWPRRGGLAGGTTLNIFGVMFSGTPTVTVGGNLCTKAVLISSTRITCTLPMGTLGLANIIVTSGGETDTFAKGYRYIKGYPEVAATSAPTVSNSPSASPSQAPSVVFPIDGKWVVEDAATLITQRHEACMAFVGRKAYLIGGRDIKPVDIYDPVTRTWSHGPAPDIQLHHVQCAAVDDKIYIVAAWTDFYPHENNSPNVYVYDTINNVWLKKTAMPPERRRGSAAAVVVGRRIYVSHGSIGGHEQVGENFVTTTGWLDYYDVDSDTWTTGLPDAPHPRDHTGGAHITVHGQNKICISGGRDGGLPDWPEIAETDCFDLDTETWTTSEVDIPQLRGGSAYGTSCDGKLIIAGGEGFGIAWNEVDVYDGISWSSLPNLNVGRHATGLAIDCKCRQMHIASGAGGQGGGPELPSMETYFFGGHDKACLA